MYIELLDILNVHFKPIVVLIGSIFTLYFAIQKIGNKVVARYEVSTQFFSAEYISKVVLTNKKDKTISIWSIYAVFENELQVELKKFDPPIVLKSYETTSLSMPKYTELTINDDKFEPNYISGKVSLFLNIGNQLIECKKDKWKGSEPPYTKLSTRTHDFNGHVYNENLKYILIYNYNGNSHTAFIDKGGMICNEWDFSPNGLARNNINPEAIKQMLLKYGFHEMFTSYACLEVEYPRIKFLFKKETKT